MKRWIVSILFPFFLSSQALAVESGSCENFFHQWMPASDHTGLHDSAFGVQWTKLGSVFVTQRDGLPFYSPVWYLGAFTHPYSPVVLLEGGSLQPTAGTLGTLKKGEMLYLVGQSFEGDEVHLKLLSKNKFSVKPGDPKPTDRVSLELVVPKGSGWCSAQKNLQGWVRGFGGLLEGERYQQIGDQPPPPGVPPPNAAGQKGKKEKETKIPALKEEKIKVVEPSPTSEPPPMTPVPPPKAPPSSPAPSAETPGAPKQKLLEPTDITNLYPPQETDLKSGMSRAEVDAKLGKPINVIKAGDKSIVYYEDVIVEFVKGRMTDIHISDKPAPSVLKHYH